MWLEQVNPDSTIKVIFDDKLDESVSVEYHTVKDALAIAEKYNIRYYHCDLSITFIFNELELKVLTLGDKPVAFVLPE